MAPDAKHDGGRLDRPERELVELMQGYLDGRVDAFDRLHAALAGRLRGYLRSQCRDAALADDLLQDTFMQIHRSRRTYEPGRPVTPWAFAIARHVYLMHARSTGRRLRFEDRVAADVKAGDIAGVKAQGKNDLPSVNNIEVLAEGKLKKAEIGDIVGIKHTNDSGSSSVSPQAPKPNADRT